MQELCFGPGRAGKAAIQQWLLLTCPQPIRCRDDDILANQKAEYRPPPPSLVTWFWSQLSHDRPPLHHPTPASGGSVSHYRNKGSCVIQKSSEAWQKYPAFSPTLKFRVDNSAFPDTCTWHCDIHITHSSSACDTNHNSAVETGEREAGDRRECEGGGWGCQWPEREWPVMRPHWWPDLTPGLMSTCKWPQLLSSPELQTRVRPCTAIHLCLCLSSPAFLFPQRSVQDKIICSDYNIYLISDYQSSFRKL